MHARSGHIYFLDSYQTMLVVQLKTCTVHSHDYLSKSDVYCVVRFQGIEKTTAVIDNCNTPDFGDTAIFIFPVDTNKDYRVFIDVYDQDEFGSDHISSDSFEAIETGGWISRTINSINLNYGFAEICTKSDIQTKIDKCICTIREALKPKIENIEKMVSDLKFTI